MRKSYIGPHRSGKSGAEPPRKPSTPRSRQLSTDIKQISQVADIARICIFDHHPKYDQTLSKILFIKY